MSLYIYHGFANNSQSPVYEEIPAYDALCIPHGSNLTEIPSGSIVVPRFRVLPFGAELEQEVISLGSKLINTWREHRSVANLYSWVHLLDGLTAPAYRLEDIPTLPEGSYFLKGETNSKKASWNTSAFAASKKDVITVAHNILNDSYLSGQSLVIRPFQDYRKIGESITGQPIFHERRAFYYKGVLLSEAHYWNAGDYGKPEPINSAAYELVQKKAVDAVSHIAPFLVIDYAEYEDGSWGVVELNDGSMSGLSENDPNVLWGSLNKLV